nr:hypothetical protein CparaKRNrm1_p025 [Cryptomonas paramecium]
MVATFLVDFFVNSKILNKHFLEYYYYLLDTWLFKKTRFFLSREKIFAFFFSGFLELKCVCVDFIMEVLFLLFYKSLKDISSLEMRKTKYLILLMLLKLKKLNIISLKTNLLTLHKFLFLRLYDVNRIQAFFFFVFDVIQIFWKLTITLSTSIYPHSFFFWEFLSIYSLRKFIKIKIKCLNWTKQFYKNSLHDIYIKKRETFELYCSSFYMKSILICKLKPCSIKIFQYHIKSNGKSYQNIFLVSKIYKIYIFTLNFIKTKYLSCKKLFRPNYMKLNSIFYKVKLFNNIYIKKKILILKNLFKLQIEIGLFFFDLFREKFKLNISFFNLKLKRKSRRLIINICILYHIKLYYTTSKYFYFIIMFSKKFLPKIEKNLKRKNKFFYKKIKFKFKKEKKINYKIRVFFKRFFFYIFKLRLNFFRKNSLLKKSKQRNFCFDFFNREFFHD